jgi:hypothetical protein
VFPAGHQLFPRWGGSTAARPDVVRTGNGDNPRIIIKRANRWNGGSSVPYEFVQLAATSSSLLPSKFSKNTTYHIIIRYPCQEKCFSIISMTYAIKKGSISFTS